MNRTHLARIEKLEKQMLDRDCRTCFNTGSIIVHVPTHAEADLPEYNPDFCEECARPLRLVRRVIGLSPDTVLRLLQRSERVA